MTRGKVVASYFYTDEQIKPIARVDRVEPGFDGAGKAFLPYRHDGERYADGPGLNGLKLPLYRLHEVRAAIAAGRPIFLVEGEGKGDRLRDALRRAHSMAAVTTIAGGCNAALRPEHIAQLAGARQVLVLADSDGDEHERGRKAARSRAQRIADAHQDCDVRAIDLYPERDDGSDVKDWLEEGHTPRELREIAGAAQRVVPSPMAPEADASCESTAIVGKPVDKILMRTLADIQPLEVRWLWKQRIVRGEFGLIAGLPGVGKSYTCAAIGAALTTGKPLPGESADGTPVDVILLSLDDSPEHVIRPRFERLGADLTRVRLIDGVERGAGKIVPFNLCHVEQLEERLQEPARAGSVLIIDPVSSELGGVDTWRSNEVRAVLDPFLSRMREYEVTVIGVCHTTKRSDGNTLFKIEGSLGGFVGRARYVLGVGQAENGQRGIGVLKSNYGATDGVPVVQYGIDGGGLFSWGSETTAIEASELFASPSTEAERSASQEAHDAIVEALRGGEIFAGELRKRVLAAGVHQATLNRVRPKMHKAGEIERLGGGVAGPVRWRLQSIDSQENPLIRTCECAKECDHVRINGLADDADELFEYAQQSIPGAVNGGAP